MVSAAERMEAVVGEGRSRQQQPAAAAGEDRKEGQATPERSLAQRMEALARANEVRSARAQLKRDLKAGRRRLDELLIDTPPYLENAKVFDMLLAVPKVGRVRVNKMLQACRISPSKTMGGLSERQRAELIALLRRR